MWNFSQCCSAFEKPVGNIYATSNAHIRGVRRSSIKFICYSKKFFVVSNCWGTESLFLAFLSSWGSIRCPVFDFFWSYDTNFHNARIACIMSLKRFPKVLQQWVATQRRTKLQDTQTETSNTLRQQNLQTSFQSIQVFGSWWINNEPLAN
jgi:hypothetical protein